MRHENEYDPEGFERTRMIERWLVRLYHLLIVLGVGYFVYSIKCWIDEGEAIVEKCGIYASMKCIEQAKKEFHEGQ